MNLMGLWPCEAECAAQAGDGSIKESGAAKDYKNKNHNQAV